MLKLVFGFIPAAIKTFSNFKNMNDIYHNLQQQQKNVSLYSFGHWVRLKVGGQPFIIRRKTLNKYGGSILSNIAQDDKISTKKISDLLSKPSSALENMIHDFELEKLRKEEEQKGKEKEQKKNENPKSVFDNNKNLPVIINHNKKTNDKESISGDDSDDGDRKEKSENEKFKEDLEDIERISKLDNGNTQIGENDEFETTINESGEKKFKFEKDHDGFYLIDRDPQYFNVILNFLRTGNLAIPPTIDINSLIADSKYYRLFELELILQRKVLEDKRKLERQEIYNNEFTLSEPGGNVEEIQFILPIKWFEEWKRFIDGSNTLPSPYISTKDFFKSIDGFPVNSLKEGLVLDIDYVCVSKDTFLSFLKYYKLVGPIIMRQSLDIYDNPPKRFLHSKVWNIK